MLTPQQVTHALLVHGYQLNDDGSMEPGLERRLDVAAERFPRLALPSAIITSGWYPLNHRRLNKYCEAEVMEGYLKREYGGSLVVMQERDSTTIPENILFTNHRFPNLRVVEVITGKKLVPRVTFFVNKVFSKDTVITFRGLDDGIGDEEKERRLLGDAICTLSTNQWVLLPPTSDGRLRSNWDELRLKHHDCPYWGKLHPGM